MDWRLLMLFVWGGGCVAVWGQVLLYSVQQYREYGEHDARARRDLVASGALFITALCSALAVFLVLFGERGTGLRGFTTALALGAFFAAGFYLRGSR